MHVEKIKLVNFGPFRQLELSLQVGSVGVVARNGAGKTTLLNALYALITGDFSRFDGLKVENINMAAADADAAYIEGTLVHHGVRAQIKRSLRPARQELIVDGERAITADKGIRERLDALLGVDKDLIGRYCFKAQNAIHDFLSDEPAARARAYQSLCRTEACEDAWTLLGRVLTKDTDLTTELVDNSDELAQQVREAIVHCATLTDRREAAAVLLLNAKSLASAEAIVVKQRTWAAALATCARLDAELQSLELVVERCKQELATAATARDVADAEEVVVTEKATIARVALTLLAHTARDRQRQEQLRCRQAQLSSALDQTASPSKPTTASKVLTGTTAALTADIQRAQAALKLLDRDGATDCPTCGAPIEASSLHVQKLRELGKSGPAQLKKLQSTLVATEAAEEAVRVWQTQRAALKQELDSVVEQLAVLGDVPESETSAALHQAVIDRYVLVVDRAEAAAAAYNRVNVAYAAAKTKMSVRTSDRQDADKLVVANLVDPALASRALARLEEHRHAERQVASLDGELRGVNVARERSESQLSQLRLQLKRRQRLRQMAKIVEAARAVLHRDVLPRGVAQVNLARIEAEINNDGLKLFGSPFWVEAQPDLTFLVHKPGEPPQKQGRLSTGQRVVLAIAFWTAVGLLWSNELGMLCLDEPTANLDETNRRFLGDALSQLTSRVRGNRQIIMVTHDPGLRNAFDQLIDLDAIDQV